MDKPITDEGPYDTNEAGVGVGVPGQLSPDHGYDEQCPHARRRHRGWPHLAVALGVELGGRVQPALVGAVPVLSLGSCSTADKKLNLVYGRRRRNWTTGTGGGRPAQLAWSATELVARRGRRRTWAAPQQDQTFDGYNTRLH
jgi:hypothetical protein